MMPKKQPCYNVKWYVFEEPRGKFCHPYTPLCEQLKVLVSLPIRRRIDLGIRAKMEQVEDIGNRLSIIMEEK